MPIKKLKVYFVGIGGIGVSALAQYYAAKGHYVSGSDLVSSEITDLLKKKRIKVFIGKHKKSNVPDDVDLIIYSPAVKENNPELIKNAKSYPEALGELTKQYFTIAVCGTHGKSTTASMIGSILIKAGFDPTIIVGTKIKGFGNFRAGKSKYMVIEADEHFASFLNYWPKMIVITNIEKDHLDYYKNMHNITKAYKRFVEHLPHNGILITSKTVQESASAKLKEILKVPGQYNVENAMLALRTARALKIPDKTSFKALSEFQGAWRRFDIRQRKGLTIVHDYAHHPTEIKAALKAAREKWPKKKIYCLFQPHQYQRTFHLFNDFVKVFSNVAIDKVIITDVYDVAGREEGKIKKKVNSEKLVKAIGSAKVIYMPKSRAVGFLKKNVKKGQVLIIMGAGDIYEIDNSFK